MHAPFQMQAYEMVLRSLLIEQEDHAQLLKLVREWPPGLFSVPALQVRVCAISHVRMLVSCVSTGRCSM